MKKLFLAIVMVIAFSGLSYAQMGTLSAPVALSVPTATKIQINGININPVSKIMVVTYRWMTATDEIIRVDDSHEKNRTWTVSNDPGEPVANCTAAGEPYTCCTGVGTGTGCRAADMAFNDIFGFTIRSADVGTKLGIGLRNLLVNRMKAKIPQLSGVTITFSE